MHTSIYNSKVSLQQEIEILHGNCTGSANYNNNNNNNNNNLLAIINMLESIPSQGRMTTICMHYLF